MQELSELLTAARRASTLTKQLLAFGRRQLMQVQRVDLNRVASQVHPMLTRVMSAQVRPPYESSSTHRRVSKRRSDIVRR
jgi:hypothetical protein